MEKLNFLGAGPRIARITIPYLAIAITLTILFPGIFKFGQAVKHPLFIAGIVFLAAGVVFYGITVSLLLKGLRNTKLITSGTYYLCRNPLYASIVLMIVPGIAFLMNSWLVLTTCIVGYLIFSRVIRTEYDEMEKFFGEAWNRYKNETPELFPFPFRKWFRSQE